MSRCLSFLASIAAIGLGALDADEKHNPEHFYLHKTQTSHPAEWSYEGANGPSHWGQLSPAYSVADSGRRQSPIDLHAAMSRDLPPLKLKYRPSRIHLIYNGHTIQDNEDAGSCEILNGKRFELQQFHFHSPSEHTVNGRHYPMEMHLVHKAKDGSVAVIGVFIEMGEHNPDFEPLWSHLPGKENPRRDAGQLVDVSRMLPESRLYFSYEGSFTTPPCTEGVHWAVLKSPVMLSADQIDRFRTVIHGNNRPVQALNGRSVFCSP